MKMKIRRTKSVPPCIYLVSLSVFGEQMTMSGSVVVVGVVIQQTHFAVWLVHLDCTRQLSNVVVTELTTSLSHQQCMPATLTHTMSPLSSPQFCSHPGHIVIIIHFPPFRNYQTDRGSCKRQDNNQRQRDYWYSKQFRIGRRDHFLELSFGSRILFQIVLFTLYEHLYFAGSSTEKTNTNTKKY